MLEPRLQFIERTGIVMEGPGVQRVAGRMLGALLTAPPHGHTASELAELLGFSRAGISTATRTLTLIGLIERVSVRGERSDCCRMVPGAWATLTEQGQRKLDAIHQLADAGLAALPEGSDPGPLQEMQNFYFSWQQEFPEERP
ncbi:GbsR/MarR family transcriptional regulator [Deinococcus oregonensis]|uniref:GbsR/MarR family transcriptional regulator n=1 Tax=Deinococcus oregonensis TaxID=1805970 RepID=A0ABV6B1L4_9DEIO